MQKLTRNQTIIRTFDRAHYLPHTICEKLKELLCALPENVPAPRLKTYPDSLQLDWLHLPCMPVFFLTYGTWVMYYTSEEGARIEAHLDNEPEKFKKLITGVYTDYLERIDAFIESAGI